MDAGDGTPKEDIGKVKGTLLLDRKGDIAIVRS